MRTGRCGREVLEVEAWMTGVWEGGVGTKLQVRQVSTHSGTFLIPSPMFIKLCFNGSRDLTENSYMYTENDASLICAPSPNLTPSHTPPWHLNSNPISPFLILSSLSRCSVSPYMSVPP